MKTLTLILAFTIFAFSSDASELGRQTQMPTDALVGDEVTAIRIAEAILVPIYGEAALAEQRPLVANLTGDVWQITGSVPPNMHFGRRFHVAISKRDGRILEVTLGRRYQGSP